MKIIRYLVLVVLVLPQAAGAVNVYFSEFEICEGFEGAWDVVVADVNSDGFKDFVAIAHFLNDVSWFENNGSERFTKHLITDNFDGPLEIDAGDVDHDGDIDIFGAAYWSGELAIWLNDGSQNFRKFVLCRNYYGAKCIVMSDLDEDGDEDFVSAAYYSDDVSWWENNGDSTFTQHSLDTAFDGSHDVFVIDLDSDGDNDILGTARYANKIAWWENDGEENFTKHIIDWYFRGSWDVMGFDLDQDGDNDVLGCGPVGLEIAWWENDGYQRFTKHIIDSAATEAIDVQVSDLDRDGDFDVIGAVFYDHRVSWYENDGNQNFTRHDIDLNVGGASTIYAADIDGDGDDDLVGTAGIKNTISWWENDSVVPIEIEMAPRNPPVRVPAGGSFRYSSTMINNIDEIRVSDIWLMLRMPDSTVFKLRVFYHVPFLPRDTVNYSTIRLQVPASAPPGTYALVALTGPPVIAMDTAGFEFTVTRPAINDNLEWGITGWGVQEAEDDAVTAAVIDIHNHPNPFNAETSIIFSLDHGGPLSVKIYNLLGQRVATLADGFYPAGTHVIEWNAAGRSSGIYFCKLNARNTVISRRMLLLK